jgi:hypothetical protein
MSLVHRRAKSKKVMGREANAERRDVKPKATKLGRAVQEKSGYPSKRTPAGSMLAGRVKNERKDQQEIFALVGCWQIIVTLHSEAETSLDGKAGLYWVISLPSGKAKHTPMTASSIGALYDLDRLPPGKSEPSSSKATATRCEKSRWKVHASSQG